MKPIRVFCDTWHCSNYQILFHDAPVPKHWICSVCEDHLQDQMLEDLARREQDRNRPLDADDLGIGRQLKQLEAMNKSFDAVFGKDAK